MGTHDAGQPIKARDEILSMLNTGRARKVTIHLNEDTSSTAGFLYEQVFDFLYRTGVAGATLTRPDAGFGSHHHLRSRDGYGSAGDHLPVRIEFIESISFVDALLPELCELVKDGLIETQDTTIVKSARQKDSA